MTMTVARKLEKRIEKWQDGTTFKYQELAIAPEDYGAATKAIERLIKKGLINRASTGVFYKPKKTAFGNLKPLSKMNEQSSFLTHPLFLIINCKRLILIIITFIII
jgi:hypothetical protein